MNLMEIENAARCAWPALEEEQLSFGVLRYSRGTDRRSNSLSLYPHVQVENEKLISAAEKFFSTRDATSIVRIVQPNDIAPSVIDGIDSALELRGYEKQAPTISMLLDLEDMLKANVNLENGFIERVDVGSWLQAWYRLTAKDLQRINGHQAQLEGSKLSHLFLLKQGVKGDVLSSGMAVYANQSVGLFGISTANAHMKKGYAFEIVNSLLGWGVTAGARFAYLQVEESNKAAINLYQKLGFKKSYSYWYRVGKHKTSNSGD